MQFKILMVFAVVLALCGCDRPYEKKDGQWVYDERPFTIVGAHFKPIKGPFAADDQVGYFRGSSIPASHGPTFRPLEGNYARDRSTVYFCDTERRAEDYFLVKSDKVVVLQGAEPDSFRPLTQNYGRDAKQIWFEGVAVPVNDVETFEVLERGFQRDRVTGYFERQPISGSDGSSFTVLGDGYTKDANSVFYSAKLTVDKMTVRKTVYRTVRVGGAVPESFSVQERDYALDARQVYYKGVAVGKNTGGFQVMSSSYAKTDSTVYYLGKPVGGADAASFELLSGEGSDANARDARRSYHNGKPVTVSSP